MARTVVLVKVIPAPERVLQVVCSWCRRVIVNGNTPKVSHGICEGCLAELLPSPDENGPAGANRRGLEVTGTEERHPPTGHRKKNTAPARDPQPLEGP